MRVRRLILGPERLNSQLQPRGPTIHTLMKILAKFGSSLCSLAVAFAVLSLASVARAHPYASGITNNAGTSISYYLNEAATDVTIVLTNNGTGQGTNIDLGATTAGLHTQTLIVNAITFTNYSIQVLNIGSGAIAQTSSDASPLNNMLSPRGVTINKNPGTKNFGRVYVSDANSGANQRGLFVRNADLSDALGQGATPSVATNARSAGLPFVGSSFSPYKLYIGPDGHVYIASTSTLTGGGFYATTDPDVTSGSLLLATALSSYTPPANHGVPNSTPVVTGTTNTGDLSLYALDIDYTGGTTQGPSSPGQSILNWFIGSGPVPGTNIPTFIANSTEGPTFNTGCDMGFYVTGGTTNYYILLSRSSYTTPGFDSLQVFDGDGNKIWGSFGNTLFPGVDKFASLHGMAISPDGQYLVGQRLETGGNVIVKLTNGIPDETTLITNIAGATTASASFGAVQWDAAENFYSVSSGTSKLRSFTLGLTTLCITSGDTTGTNGDNHGSFELIFPNPTVSVSATTPGASQNHGSPIPGVFTLSRSTNGISTAPLTIYFVLGGTAPNGTYTATAGTTNFVFGATNSVTLPGGVLSTNIIITPDTVNVPRPTETVTLTIVINPLYSVAVGAPAAVAIANTGPQALFVSGVGAPSMYKGLTNDYASVMVTRWGDTNASSYTPTNFSYSGTPVVGVDFTPASLTFSPGDVSKPAVIRPLQTNTNYVGNQTITIGVLADAGVGYSTIGSSNATVTYIDNAHSASPLLFADPLTDPAGATNWILTFANTNNVPDYDVEFGYTLANDSVGPAPNGSTTALKVTVNKNGNTAAAGVNLYPTNQNFTGNFACRFSMNLVEGTDLLQGNDQRLATEYAIFGIDHTGTATNWFAGDFTSGTQPQGIDGVWYGINSQIFSTTIGDYTEFTGEGTNSQYGYVPLAVGTAGSGVPQNLGGESYTNFVNAFKNSFDIPSGPFSAAQNIPGTVYLAAGSFANCQIGGGRLNSWVDVEIKQINNVITMAIDKTPVFVYTNTILYTNGTGSFTISTNGTVMLGYDDPYGDVGSGGAAYFSNIRVVSIAPPTITSISVTGGNVVLGFTSTLGDDTPASFTVLGSGTTGNARNVDTVVAATITQQSANTFKAVFPLPSTSAAFYRIKYN